MVINGYYVIKILSRFEEPVTIDRIVHALKKNSNDAEDKIRTAVEHILKISTDNGFVHRENKYFFITPGLDLAKQLDKNTSDEKIKLYVKTEEDVGINFGKRSSSDQSRLSAQNRQSRQESSWCMPKSTPRSKSLRSQKTDSEDDIVTFKVTQRPSSRSRTSIDAKEEEYFYKMGPAAFGSATPRSRRSKSKPKPTGLAMLDEDESHYALPVTRSRLRAARRQSYSDTSRLNQNGRDQKHQLPCSKCTMRNQYDDEVSVTASESASFDSAQQPDVDNDYSDDGNYDYRAYKSFESHRGLPTEHQEEFYPDEEEPDVPTDSSSHDTVAGDRWNTDEQREAIMYDDDSEVDVRGRSVRRRSPTQYYQSQTPPRRGQSNSRYYH